MKNKTLSETDLSVLKPIFWDLDPAGLNIQENSRQIIERVLEWGDFQQVRWMIKTYPKEQIIEAVKLSRQLSKKSANFWAFYYNIHKSEVRCLTRLLQKEQKVLWPY